MNACTSVYPWLALFLHWWALLHVQRALLILYWHEGVAWRLVYPMNHYFLLTQFMCTDNVVESRIIKLTFSCVLRVGGVAKLIAPRHKCKRFSNWAMLYSLSVFLPVFLSVTDVYTPITVSYQNHEFLYQIPVFNARIQDDSAGIPHCRLVPRKLKLSGDRRISMIRLDVLLNTEMSDRQTDGRI